MITKDELKINTIYIISKGRPQCLTAQTLEKIHYPGKYFIVCGNNDETLPEYQRNWGNHVLIFDWYEQIKTTDTLDNFGFEKKASGACPVRNAVRAISESRGEVRHWQMDDDFTGFYRYDGKTGKNKIIKDGKILFSTMYRIAKFGYDADISDVGFHLQAIEAAPTQRYTFNYKVSAVHNMPSQENRFVKWVGRGVDDFIHTFNDYKAGNIELQFKYLQLTTPTGKKVVGGLEQYHNLDGAVRRYAYIFLIAPAYAKIISKKLKDGSLYIGAKMNWSQAFPKIVNEKWKK